MYWDGWFISPYKLFASWIFNIGKRGGGLVCSVPNLKFFSGYFIHPTENAECGMVVIAKPTSPNLLSMVVDRASTFLVGVFIRFGRQVDHRSESQFKQLRNSPTKSFSGLQRDSTRGLCVRAAVLHHLSYETHTLEAGQFIEFINP